MAHSLQTKRFPVASFLINPGTPKVSPQHVRSHFDAGKPPVTDYTMALNRPQLEPPAAGAIPAASAASWDPQGPGLVPSSSPHRAWWPGASGWHAAGSY